jgi:hypothetical protein
LGILHDLLSVLSQRPESEKMEGRDEGKYSETPVADISPPEQNRILPEFNYRRYGWQWADYWLQLAADAASLSVTAFSNGL